MQRRTFLGSLAALVAGGCTAGPGVATGPTDAGLRPPTTGASSSTTSILRPLVEAPEPPAVDLGPEVFALGVASGDPAHDSVVLWTRLIGDLPDATQLLWELSYDSSFDELAATGIADVASGFAHSAHVIARGLPAETRFHYRFRVGSSSSPVGRTKTLAAPGTSPDELRLAVSSCQLMETGYWAAHRDLAEADLDLVVWLGDFIYGGAGSSPYEGRAHRGNDPVGLGAYRDRYAQYRADPVLQAASAAHPWVAAWDDHEVVNDYDASVDPGRRAAAYQAWWEHLPTRLPAPGSTGFEIYRSVNAGDLCRLTLLDTRQHADEVTLLGQEQRNWLEAELNHDATWTVLGSPVLVGGLLVPNQDEVLLPYTWDGYPDERSWLADQLATKSNRLCVSGDLHSSAVLEVHADPADRSLPVVATEFMAPAISSEFPKDFAALAPFIPLANAHVDHFDTANGWLLLTLTPDAAVAEFRTVDDIADPNSAVSAGPRFEVAAGDPTPRRL